MPHVVVEGPIELEAIRGAFAKISERDGADILKVEDLYLRRDGAEVLFDTLVVESGHRQRFFIRLVLKEGGGTVRLLPQTDPEKTPGVKRAVARVARFVRDLRPGDCRFGATNIGELLRERS